MFNLEGIAPAPRGVPQIEVTFDIDANGIVHVSAKDLGTGKEQKIRIESSSGLSEADIDKMVKEAEAHAEDDKKARETIEAKNNAETTIYATEKALKDYGDKVSPQERTNIEEAVKDLKETLANANATAEEIKSKVEKVQSASMQLGQKVYEASQQAQQNAQNNAGAQQSYQETSQNQNTQGGNDDTMDASFEEVK